MAGEPVAKDIFEGIDLTWGRMPGGDAVAKLLSKAVAGYSDEDPAASVPALVEALAAVDRLPPDTRVAVKRRELLEVITQCTGLWVEAVAADPSASPGSSVDITASAVNRSTVPLTLSRVGPSEACGWSFEQQLNLLNEVQRMFPLNPLLIALNKIDITPESQLEVARARLPNAYEIVAVNRIGVDQLLQDALEEIDLKPMQESIDEYMESLSRE